MSKKSLYICIHYVDVLYILNEQYSSNVVANLVSTCSTRPYYVHVQHTYEIHALPFQKA